jgi:hypothetical protein
MSRLKWRAIPHGELAILLKEAKLADSRAVGTSTVYHLSRNGQDVMAVSLPDGQAVVVELNNRPHTFRRRVDPTKN